MAEKINLLNKKVKIVAENLFNGFEGNVSIHKGDNIEVKLISNLGTEFFYVGKENDIAIVG